MGGPDRDRGRQGVSDTVGAMASFRQVDGCRLEGLGTEVVSMIVKANPGRRLVAFPIGGRRASGETISGWGRSVDPENRLRPRLLVSPMIG